MKIYKDKYKKIKIYTLNDWYQHCPPKNKSKQWVDGRSAKELAKFWINEKNQNDFLESFLSRKISGIDFDYAIPEMATSFDNYKNPRKNDLIIFAKCDAGSALVSIEGKSDEPFGNRYLFDEFCKAISEKRSNHNSRKLDRLIELYNRFGNQASTLEIRYQLLFWLAGMIDEAERNKEACVILIVQEFDSNLTDSKKKNDNEIDLNKFLFFISNSKLDRLDSGQIVGPIKNNYTKCKNLYLGKFSVNLDQN